MTKLKVVHQIKDMIRDEIRYLQNYDLLDYGSDERKLKYARYKEAWNILKMIEDYEDENKFDLCVEWMEENK